MTETIRLSGISKIYGEKNTLIKVNALKNIHLTFQTNRIYAIMGASGSGKSTLMHIIGLLDRPTAGKYYLQNEDTSVMGDSQLALFRNRKIGFVFQSFNLLPKYSVYKNVGLPLLYSDQTHEKKHSAIINILEKVGLENRRHHKPNQLSGGEKQRAAIARALINNSSIILADEPTGNLDSKNEKDILGLFNDLKGPDRTIIIVTHNHNVAKISDEIILIKDGEIQ